MKIKVNPPVNDEDRKEEKLFKEAVKVAKKKAKIMGCAVAGYDERKKKAYIDYPDKDRIYFD
jgi:hypothetical protein